MLDFETQELISDFRVEFSNEIRGKLSHLYEQDRSNVEIFDLWRA